MPPAHRQGDPRICGAVTTASQGTVRVNGRLWAIQGTPNSHNAGGLIASNTGVFIHGTPVIKHPDPAVADSLCPILGGPHCGPGTSGGSPNVFAYGGGLDELLPSDPHPWEPPIEDTDYTLSGMAVLASAAAAGAASATAPGGYSLTGAAALAAVSGAGTAAYVGPAPLTASGDIVLPAIVAGGAANYGVTVHYVASGAAALQSVAVSGSAALDAGAATASANVVLPSLSVAATTKSIYALVTETGNYITGAAGNRIVVPLDIVVTGSGSAQLPSLSASGAAMIGDVRQLTIESGDKVTDQSGNILTVRLP